MSIKAELEKITTELGAVVSANNRIRAGINQARGAKAEAATARDAALSDVHFHAANARMIAANQSLASLEPELAKGEARDAELRPRLAHLAGELEHERLAEITTEYQAALKDGVGKMNAAVAAILKWVEVRERARLMFPNDASPNGRRIPPGSGLPFFDATMIARIWDTQKLEIARHYPEALPEGDPARVQAARIAAAIADDERISTEAATRQRDANKAAGHTPTPQRVSRDVEAFNPAFSARY